MREAKRPTTKIEWLLCIWRHNVSPSSWLVTFSSEEYFRRWKLSAFPPALSLSPSFTPFLAHFLRNEEAFRFYSVFISVRCASNANKTNIARDKMILLAIDRSIPYVVGRRWYSAMHSFTLYNILLFRRERISSYHKCIYYCRGAPTRAGRNAECGALRRSLFFYFSSATKGWLHSKRKFNENSIKMHQRKVFTSDFVSHERKCSTIGALWRTAFGLYSSMAWIFKET